MVVILAAIAAGTGVALRAVGSVVRLRPSARLAKVRAPGAIGTGYVAGHALVVYRGCAIAAVERVVRPLTTRADCAERAHAAAGRSVADGHTVVERPCGAARSASAVAAPLAGAGRGVEVRPRATVARRLRASNTRVSGRVARIAVAAVKVETGRARSKSRAPEAHVVFRAITLCTQTQTKLVQPLANGRVSACKMDGWMDGWMGGWMDGWMDGWTDERMDGYGTVLWSVD